VGRNRSAHYLWSQSTASAEVSTQRPAGEVKTFWARLPRQQREVVEALRLLVLQAASGAAESILWGSLSYHRPSFGGRIKGAVCLITPKADCIHLGFIHGASIPDPHRLLCGGGKAKRFVPVRSLADINREELRGLIHAAAEYDPRQMA
jgi:hypothetical protein